MSGGGDNQTTTVQNPPWLDQASQGVLGAAGNAMGAAQPNPLQTGAYATAGMYGSMAPGALGQAYNVQTQNANYQANPDWLSPLAGMLSGGGGGFGMSGGGGGGGGGSIGPVHAANADTSTIDTSQLQQLTPHSSLDYNVGQYMDPYTQQVIDANASDIERSRQLQGNNDAASAMSTGAFGGSRSGVVSALTNSEYDRNQAANSAQLHDQAFNNAQGRIAGDMANATNADMANQQQQYQALLANAGFQNSGSQFNAGQANQLTADQLAAQTQQNVAGINAGASRYAAGLNASNQRLSTLVNGALGYGQLGLGADLNAATLRGNSAIGLQNFGQAGMNAESGAGDAIYNQPFNDIGWMSGIVGNVPHGQSSSQPINHNRAAGALGGAATGAAAGSDYGGWGTAIGALGGGLMGYFGS